jgi:pyridoxamine 5'-phosphate oxidase
VLLKGFDPSGFVFFTNFESQKGRELAENPRAAMVFFWPTIERQVRIIGSVKKIAPAESEAYFHTRPRGSQIGAWASHQSQVIEGREALEKGLAAFTADFEGKTVPLPPNWGGFRLAPTSVEFWQTRPNRLHDRLRYTRRADNSWRIERLAP